MSQAVALKINGVERQVLAGATQTLLEVLRDQLGLTGSKRGCNQGVCGACTILLDGRTARSCLHFAVAVDGSEVDTVEGVASQDLLHPIQEAFHQHHALQCGYCTPGFLMTTIELLKNNPNPDEAAIRRALTNNICRCTGYTNIIKAVAAAAAALQAQD